MQIKEYDRSSAVKYAHKWAYLRNPKYYNFDSVGGDCTSFVSQCILQGSSIMNEGKENPWYYKNGNEKSPSWSGVEFLYQFLITNKGVGPYGREVELEQLQMGDIIQLCFDGKKYTHTVIIIEMGKTIEEILVAAHTFDTDYRKLTTYSFEKMRGVHIEGIRIW